MDAQARHSVEAFIAACRDRRVSTTPVYKRVTTTSSGRLLAWTASKRPITEGWVLPEPVAVEDATHAVVLPVGLVYGAMVVRRKVPHAQRKGGPSWENVYVLLDEFWRPASPHDHGLTQAMYDYFIASTR
ncbi:hypothetical protein CLV56_0905 [Mumia flava]|uniref:Uncharacterized protein n=1 Tax=Mumia flava TaxID=1348852 RepID=A0A0B2B7A6_9ACTN|nr:hypothetical protein [Mumia flava]PJJ56694.1 hypothetical protein CLV56_0905 [Mumia flava]